MKYQEVIRFACGISHDSQHVLDFAYETLLRSLLSDALDRDDVEELMKSLCHEVSGKGPSMVLNNEYINYVEEGCEIFVPSRFYVFDSDSQGVKLHVNQGALTAGGKAQCIVNINGTQTFLSVMKTIDEICKYQEVEILSLNLDGVNLDHTEETRRSLQDVVHATCKDDYCDSSFKGILRDVINTAYQTGNSNNNERFVVVLFDIFSPAECVGANANADQVIDRCYRPWLKKVPKLNKLEDLSLKESN